MIRSSLPGIWDGSLNGQNVFYTSQLNAPVGQNMMWNTSILAESVTFGWLVPLIGATTLYNYLWLFNFVVACILGRAILSEIGTSKLPAFVGGLLMGIMPYETSQMLFHLHLWFTAPILGMILVLIKQYQGKFTCWKGGILLGFLAAFEFYTSLETCVTFALCLAIFWAIGSLLKRSPIIVGNRTTWGATVFIATILCLPGLYGLFIVPGRPHGSLLPVGYYVDDLLTSFIPTPVYLFHTSWMTALSTHYTGNFWENDGYIGISAIMLLVYGTWLLRRNRFILTATISAIVIAILSLGQTLHLAGHVTHIVLPWVFAELVPFLRDVIPSRLMLFGDILIAIILMLTWDKVIKGQGRERYAASFLVILVLLSWLPMTPYYSSRKPVGEDVILNNPALLEDLSGQSVLVLTSDSSIFMGTMVDSGYSLSMVNPYGYSSNQSRRNAIRLFNTVAPHMNSQKIEQLLSQTVPETKATRIVYLPVEEGDSIPQLWNEELIKHYGSPILASDGVEVWQGKSLHS